MGKKKDPIFDEIEAIKERIEEVNARFAPEVEKLTQYADNAVAQEALRLTELLEKYAKTSEESVEASKVVMKEHVATELVDVNVKITQSHSYCESIESKVAEIHSKNIPAIMAHVEKVEHELKTSMEEAHKQLANATVEASQRAAAALEHEILEMKEKTTDVLLGMIKKLDANIQEEVAEKDRKCEQLDARIVECNSDISKLRADTHKTCHEMVDAFTLRLQHLNSDMRNELFSTLTDRFELLVAKGLNEIIEKTQEQVEYLGEVVEDHGHVVTNCKWMMENMYTRCITWKVSGFQRKSFALMRSQECYLTSPDFSCCGIPAMCMELMVLPQETPAVSMPLPGSNDGTAIMPVPGMCCLRMWAPRGLSMSFRIFIGDGASAMSKTYEHTFEIENIDGAQIDDQDRVSFLMRNVGIYQQAWHKETDKATFGFEILQFKFLKPVDAHLDKEDKIELPDGPEVPEELADRLEEATDDGPKDDDGDGIDDEEREALVEAERRAKEQKEIDEKLADITVGDPFGDGEIGASRFATSELFLKEKIDREQLTLKNKAVRRIEWKLQGCSYLLEKCGPGQAVDSPPFNASGLMGLQMHFYPKGDDPNPSGGPAGMWCALYISGPGHTTLRGQLNVGVFNKSFDHRFKRKGDAGGRSRFCNLSTNLDAEDSILLALDISQTEMEVPDQPHGMLVLRNAGSNAKGDDKDAVASPVSGSKGVLKMKRGDPTKIEEVGRCVSLPTLNARERQRPLAKQLLKVT